MYEVLPMSTVSNSCTDFTELVDHLKTLTRELTSLHGDLYWLAMQGAEPKADLNIEILTSLKSAVDDMRLLLWNYIEAASQVDPQRVGEEMETQRVQRITQFLKLLRERLGSNPEQQPVSFIEKVSAAMEQRLGDRVA
jgi:hypothetical protein